MSRMLEAIQAMFQKQLKARGKRHTKKREQLMSEFGKIIGPSSKQGPISAEVAKEAELAATAVCGGQL